MFEFYGESFSTTLLGKVNTFFFKLNITDFLFLMKTEAPRVAHAHEAEPAEVLTRRSFCLGLGNTLNLLCFLWFTTGFYLH